MFNRAILVAAVILLVSLISASEATACQEPKWQNVTCDCGGTLMVRLCGNFSTTTDCCPADTWLVCGGPSCMVGEARSISCGKQCILSQNTPLGDVPEIVRARLYVPSCQGGFVPALASLPPALPKPRI